MHKTGSTLTYCIVVRAGPSYCHGWKLYVWFWGYVNGETNKHTDRNTVHPYQQHSNNKQNIKFNIVFLHPCTVKA